MKSRFILITLFVLSFSLVAAGGEKAGVKPIDWDAYSKNLVRAFDIPNEGVHLSAMQRIIQYGDKLDVDAVVFDVVRYYRDHKDQNVRHLALTALYKMGNEWAIGFLRRAQAFEDNLVLKKHITCILRACDAAKDLANQSLIVQLDNK